MNTHQSAYEAAFAKLNEGQRKAVLTTEGPVMVLAGPGTGKTQVLATRIGYILDNTDTNPQNILCLTFTDAGVVAMRERLVKFIGKEAYKVNIHTFHSFCNMVIQANTEYFTQNFQLNVADDLQKKEIVRKMIDLLPVDDVNKRLKNAFYLDENKYMSLFSEMKRENISTEQIEADGQFVMQRVEDFEDMVYLRKSGENNKGDKKLKDIAKIREGVGKLVAASRQLETYNALLAEDGLYDYDDMINWVVNAFERDENLLLDYQEQYLYIMVDEFQDTNGIQIKLLNQLCSFWGDSPNVFVVGDDDQAIYRFQGANVDNLSSFYEKYKPAIVCLTKNYRSKPDIITTAKNLITNNKSRLGSAIPGVVKDILPGKECEDNGSVAAFQYANNEQEDTAIICWIENHIKAGVKPKQLAVVSRNHDGLRELVNILQKKQIPVFVKTKVNALHIPVVRNLVTILRFLDSCLRDPYDAHICLAEIIQYPNQGIQSFDVLKLIRYVDEINFNKENKEKIWLAEIIGSEKHLQAAGVSDADVILSLSRKIENWLAAVHTETIQVLFEKILSESGILEFVLNSANKINLLEAIHVLFNFIKEKTTVDDSFNLHSLVVLIKKMEELKIDLPFIKITGNSEGVQMMTAHATKGLEYPYVWIKGADAAKWEVKRGSSGSFMSGLFKAILRIPDVARKKDAEEWSKVIQLEDERRLFFVATTRAEEELIMSYSPKTSDKKETPSRFLIESMQTDEIPTAEVNQTALVEHLALKIRKSELDQENVEREYLDRILKDFKLSSTALNNYLKCPLRFYYSNIMRIPQARSAGMGFGNVVHKVLERLWKYQKEAGGWDAVHDLDTRIVQYIEEAMKQFQSHFNPTELKNNFEEGKKKLPLFIKSQLAAWRNIPDFKTEYKIQTILDGKIPLTGNLDRLDILKDDIHVTDYKTGSLRPEQLKSGLADDKGIGGDYWRQMVFYKILVDLDNSFSRQMTSGTMQYVTDEKNGIFSSQKFTITPEEIQMVSEQIEDTYAKILRHDFYKGCGKQDCHYCHFVNDIKSLSLADESDAEYSNGDDFASPQSDE